MEPNSQKSTLKVGYYWRDYVAGLLNRILRRGHGIYTETEARLLIAEQVNLIRYQGKRMAEMLDRHPKEPVIWREMALVMQEEANWKELLGFSAQIRQRFPNLAFGYRIGASAHFNDGDTATAEELAFRAILRFPQNPDCYFVFAECAEKRGDLPEAMTRRRAIIARFPDAKWASHGLMSTMLRAGEARAADDIYRNAIGRLPRDRDILNIGARIAEANGDRAEAAKRWQKILDIDSHNVAAHYGVIENWIGAGRPDLSNQATEHRDFLFASRKGD